MDGLIIQMILELIPEIKRKKELSGIPDEIVKEILEKEIKKGTPKGEKDIKIIIKRTREKLRDYVGRFTLSKGPSPDDPDILKAHKSTKERLDFYPELKRIISSFHPRSILDLGCGLNPIALASNDIEYHASDIDSTALNIVSEYFKKHKIRGSVKNQDIRNMDFPQADLCLIFKVFDILKLPHSKVNDILSRIKSKDIIVSFPTITLSGKPMKNKRRFWFEDIIKSLGYDFKTVSSRNELFYIIEK